MVTWTKLSLVAWQFFWEKTNGICPDRKFKDVNEETFKKVKGEIHEQSDGPQQDRVNQACDRSYLFFQMVQVMDEKKKQKKHLSLGRRKKWHGKERNVTTGDTVLVLTVTFPCHIKVTVENWMNCGDLVHGWPLLLPDNNSYLFTSLFVRWQFNP